MIEASQAYVKIIIRRPHAYEFKSKHGKAPIPGLAVLDWNSRVLAAHDLRKNDVAEFLKKNR